MKAVKSFGLTLSESLVKAGQPLKGTLHFTLRDTITVRCIVLTFEGRSRTGFSPEGDASEEWIFKFDIPLSDCLSDEGNKAGRYQTGRRRP